MRSVICALFLLLVTWPSIGQDTTEFNFKNAGDYNNFIMKEMTATVQKNFEYISLSVHSDEFDQLENKRNEVIRQISLAKENIAKMPRIDGDARLRDEALDVLNEYQNAFTLDYKDIIGLKKKSKDSYESMEAYFRAEDEAEAKVNKATSQLRKAQAEYAEKNNMKIVENKTDDQLEQKMNKVIAVNNYWRVLFLNYFKVSRQYDLMWDALSQKKASVIDRERVRTIKVIDDVLPQLRSIGDFKGDTEFKDQTVNIIEYFQKVAAKDFVRIVDILGKRTLDQPDIDEVNGIINKCNADHERLIYNWNIASQDLFRKNVDKE